MGLLVGRGLAGGERWIGLSQARCVRHQFLAGHGRMDSGDLRSIRVRDHRRAGQAAAGGEKRIGAGDDDVARGENMNLVLERLYGDSREYSRPFTEDSRC